MSDLLRKIVMMVLFVISVASGAMAATQQDIDNARAKGLAWLISDQNGDGSWKAAAGLEVQSTATALEALMNGGITQGFDYGAAVSWLENTGPSSVDSLSRKIMALSGTGTNVQPDIDRLMTYKNNSARAIWGAYDQYDTSFPDTSLAIGAVRTGNNSYYLSSTFVNYLANSVYCVIIPAQLTNGGWSYIVPLSTAPASMTDGAVIPTAYNIIELQAAKNANTNWGIYSYSCGGPSYYLPTQINNAVNWLLTNKKNADNGFGDNGQSTILETALVYQALNAVNSANPAKGAALDYLISQQDASGSWGGGDPFQTAMVLKSLPATTLIDTDKDGLPDVVEVILGKNPSVADSRDLIKGNGQSISGLTAPSLLATVYKGHAFSQTLTAGGGTAPYSYSVVSGSLPDGLVLASTGTISGTPTTVGSFNFTYKVTDAVGLTSTVASQIIVLSDTTPPVSTITKPASGAVVMAPAITITGTASYAGSQVQKVEVSTNGGSTWNLATGTTSWSFVWTVPSDGTYTIKSRATDTEGNVETAGAGITITVYQRQPSNIATSGRQLLVNGSQFLMKGVVYSPIPIGDDPETTMPFGDYFTSGYSDIYTRDLPLLRTMGANTVRLWTWNETADHHDFLDKAYNGGVNPIYVIAGFWINAGLDIDPNSPSNVREQLKADFRGMVAAHKNHPAILMWAIGNDLNADTMYGTDKADLFSLINEMAGAAHAEEGAGYHPVTTPLFDSNLTATVSTYDATVPDLDIWGANVYRGNTFGTLFNDYTAVSTKPLAIFEYGIDAYDNTNGDEYENIGTPYQADYAESLWNEILANTDSCIGGSIMEYSDQWWNGNYGSGSGCPDSDPSVQSACGFADMSQPDTYSNEEWWGLMRISKNGSNPDNMAPRAVYYSLKKLWTDTSMSPVISSDISSLSFGSQNVGQASSARTVTVSNTGTANLSVGAITITGTNPQDFAVQRNTCSGRTIVPAGSCLIDVVFSPTAPGVRAANLGVSSNDPVRGTLTVSLQGTGIDTLPPTGSIAINSGASWTNTTAVTLTLTAADASLPIQMCISNTTSCTTFSAFAATKAWTLTTGDGTKTVRVWFKDALGNTTPTGAPYQNTIVLDTTAPVNGTLTATPGSGQITLNWSGFSDASSGIGSYKLVYATGSAPSSCTAGTVLYSGGLNTTFTHTGLSNQVYGYRVCAIDNAGNVSTGVTKTATPLPSESDPPTGSVLINSDASWTNTTAVNLTLTATDASLPIQMCISNTTSCTTFSAFAATKAWTLTTGDGTKTVYAWFKDAWNNTTATAYTDTIVLDTTAPVNGTLTATPGSGQITLSWSGFSDASSGIGSYKLVYATGSAPYSCAAGTVLYSGGLNTTFTHTGLNSSLTYYYRVCAIDNAGNTSTGATKSARPGS